MCTGRRWLRKKYDGDAERNTASFRNVVREFFFGSFEVARREQLRSDGYENTFWRVKTDGLVSNVKR